MRTGFRMLVAASGTIWIEKCLKNALIAQSPDHFFDLLRPKRVRNRTKMASWVETKKKRVLGLYRKS